MEAARPCRPARTARTFRTVSRTAGTAGAAGDRIADIGLFLFAACFAVLTADAVLAGERPSPDALFVDQAVGALACASLFVRRRWPVQLAVVLLVAGVFSHFVTGATVVAVFTVAAGRPLRTTGLVAGVAFAPVPFFLASGPALDDPRTVSGMTYFALLAAAIGWGLFVRSRRQLVASLRERAERAHEEARRTAREDIAREMHDVLAHRLSLLSVHAGALQFNPEAPAEEVQRTAGVIRESAHEALEDLREVIGVLRGTASSETARPQPELGDLGRLAEESRAAGTDVTLRVETASWRDGADGSRGAAGGGRGGSAAPPAAVGRTAYRIVQEALTNARKHAPRSPVTVTVSGGPGEGLTVLVRNPAPADARRQPGPDAGEPGAFAPEAVVSGVPGAGQGLVGLAERAELAGGTMEYGRFGADFRVRAWLPWAPGRDPLEAAAPAPDPAL
ncbi:two-component sensor histidine kinase [Streptomyces daqingensis]|uniref:histidine kinase n=1 Tax=Streptomyces daqingensis TaxID=1472640 RepID=A0ABQ2MKN8_9ACTN|nr:two-component sensor histidine kinase [Streptomyces daqingensis]